MGIFLIWLALSVLCGMYASKLNRSSIGYFLLSCFLSPIVGFIALLVLGNNISIESLKEDKKVYSRYRVEVDLDYDDALKKALNFYGEYNLLPSEYNTDDDYEKKFKNDNDEYFVIKKVNQSVVIESCNLPKFQDIKSPYQESKKTNIDDLVKISELYEKGLLNKEEFEIQKAKLLN